MTKTARRRTSSTRRKGRRKQQASTPLPTPLAGEHIFLLALPFGMRHPQVTYRKDLKTSIYVGAQLPAELSEYAAQPYTYEAWLQDQLNRTPPASQPTTAPKTPRPTQVADARSIVTAAAAGHRGFLVANDTGTGKTITCILAAKAICALRGGDTVLITVDRPAAITIPMWRHNIAAVGDGGLRWIVVSSDGGLKKMMHTNGAPRINPDVVINDEAHQFRRDSQRTGRMERMNRLSQPPGPGCPFVISVTATPGHHPGEYRYLAALLAQLNGEPTKQWSNLGKRLADLGLPLEQSYGQWGWNAAAKTQPELRDEATSRVRDWMLTAQPPAMLNRPAPWGPAHMDGLPVTLTADQRRLYNTEWGDYQREMRLARRGGDIARGLAALTRFRQKASHLRIDSTVERVKADLEQGYQVLVAVEHVTTAAQPIAEALEAEGITVAHLYGSRPDVETQRLRFQKGHATVAVINTVSSLSLHAGEELSDGTRATVAPRRGYFHQPRYSGIAAKQMMGRSHRDGQHCDWFLLYAENTVEQQAASRMVERLVTTATSVDADTSTLASIAALFGADWLPADKALAD